MNHLFSSPDRWSLAIGLFLSITWLGAPVLATPPKIEFRDGERVVLIGTAVFERDYTHGHLETALTLAAGEREVTFRNLAWSGDTVFGHARSYFGPPEEGLDRLAKLLEGLDPGVVLLCYGVELAHGPEPDVDGFLEGYAALVDRVRAASGAGTVVIVSPPPLESLGPPLPAQEEANRRLADLSVRLAGFARRKDCAFVDWFGRMHREMNRAAGGGQLTGNGIHYTAEGYRVLAAALLSGLGLEERLEAGDREALRRAILAKNELFFRRWRPANETYLHGFRKHEQGQNAAELLEFEPMVAAKDRLIHELKTSSAQ